MKYSEYEIRFVTIAPVFIGGGEKRSSKEYIKFGNDFFFPKMDDFIQKIAKKSQRNARLYQAFMKFMTDPRKRLTAFCKEMNISIDELNGYVVKAPFGNKTGELNDILQFNRDPYGKVFIPGSSIKGLIRTVLENTSLKENNNKDEIFSHLIVQDSAPISDSNLVLTQKWDLSCKPYAKPKSLPIFREALKPRCLFSCKIKVMENQDELSGMINSLAKLSHEYYQRYMDYFLNDFSNDYVQNIKLNPNVGICYLGGGSGFWSKVMINDHAKKVIRKKKNVKHNGALKLTKFPAISKLGVSNSDGFYEMGKCIFEVKKLKEQVVNND